MSGDIRPSMDMAAKVLTAAVATFMVSAEKNGLKPSDVAVLFNGAVTDGLRTGAMEAADSEADKMIKDAIARNQPPQRKQAE